MVISLVTKPMLRLSVVILVNENLLRLAPLCKDNSQRHYARWSVRKPSKAIYPEDSSSEDVGTQQSCKSEFYSQKNQVEKILSESNTEKSSNQLKYKVLKDNDPLFSKLMIQVGNRKMRTRNNIIMLEGKRLNMDAMKAGLKPKNMFFTQKSILEALNLSPSSKVPLYKLPYETVSLWSKLDTPPGVVGFYSIPKEDDITPVDTLPIKVLCDNVRDPGNLGSIIRVAASVGCTQVLLMKGCTDPWDSKVLRSASGGHFHIPISIELSWSEQMEFIGPMDQIFIADSQLLRNNSDMQLYHQVNFGDCASVLVVIGGETEGLSSEALRLEVQRNATRLYIPLSNCMESLNSGSALSVILFEIKRQMLKDPRNQQYDDKLSVSSKSK